MHCALRTWHITLSHSSPPLPFLPLPSSLCTIHSLKVPCTGQLNKPTTAPCTLATRSEGLLVPHLPTSPQITLKRSPPSPTYSLRQTSTRSLSMAPPLHCVTVKLVPSRRAEVVHRPACQGPTAPTASRLTPAPRLYSSLKLSTKKMGMLPHHDSNDTGWCHHVSLLLSWDVTDINSVISHHLFTIIFQLHIYAQLH